MLSLKKMNNKTKSIQNIIKVIEEHFGKNAFTILQTDEINSILYKKELKDEIITFSIIETETSQKSYSLQVTCEGERHRKFIGKTNKEALYMDLDIPIDKEVDINELIEIFEKYK